jgi:hypothetical protein
MTYERQTITIDGKDYDPEGFSAEKKAQVDMIVACDRKLADLQAESAIVQTARNAYVSALRELLAKDVAN